MVLEMWRFVKGMAPCVESYYAIASVVVMALKELEKNRDITVTRIIADELVSSSMLNAASKIKTAALAAGVALPAISELEPDFETCQMASNETRFFRLRSSFNQRNGLAKRCSRLEIDNALGMSEIQNVQTFLKACREAPGTSLAILDPPQGMRPFRAFTQTHLRSLISAQYATKWMNDRMSESSLALSDWKDILRGGCFDAVNTGMEGVFACAYPIERRQMDFLLRSAILDYACTREMHFAVNESYLSRFDEGVVVDLSPQNRLRRELTRLHMIAVSYLPFLNELR